MPSVASHLTIQRIPSRVAPLAGSLALGRGGSRYRNSMISTRNEPPIAAKLCELLDWENNIVAIVKEDTDPMLRGNCHNYALDPVRELKVSMVARKICNAKLYKVDKNPDAKKIGEVGIEDFLVWPKSHVRYM